MSEDNKSNNTSSITFLNLQNQVAIDSLIKQYSDKSFFTYTIPQIGNCLTKCVDSFEKNSLNMNEKACLEKCFYTLLENRYINELD